MLMNVVVVGIKPNVACIFSRRTRYGDIDFSIENIDEHGNTDLLAFHFTVMSGSSHGHVHE